MNRKIAKEKQPIVDSILFNQFDIVKRIVSDSLDVYLYMRERVHPYPQREIEKFRGKALVINHHPLYPDDYYSICISKKELTSDSDFLDDNVIELWSTIFLPYSCNQDKALAMNTATMIASILTFLGVDVYINNEFFDPSEMILQKIDKNDSESNF